MPAAQKLPAIFLFEASGLVIYCSKQPQGMNFPFPSGSIEHMEIINYDLMRDMVTQACATLELTDSNGLVVFGKSLLFEKQAPALAEDKLQLLADQFRDSTPFERVVSHVYKNAQGSLLISMNRDFYDTLRQILERGGVHVIGVVPQFILTGVIGTGAIQAKSLTLLASRIDEIALQSIIVHKAAPKTLQEKQEYISKKYSGIVVVIFVLFLILVIGGTFYILRSQFSASRSSAEKAMTIVTAPPEATILPTPTTLPSENATQSAVKVSITYAPEVASSAAQLEKLLKANPNTQVVAKSQAGLQGNQPLIIFKQSFPVGNRTEIQNEVKEIFPTVAVQELAQLDSDVSITLSK